ncbi:hypothetical protein ACO0K9_08770 [Undibacterium sp. Ji50W]|uniref:hypothetical protein n=1 Tax=Undibacterium sp. Ji50W TaxID=3413041 RepID=UPI003BF42C74
MSLRQPLGISLLLLISLISISACDRLGLPDPARDAAARESDARATGSACRHAGRAIEDCYALNPDAARAAVYAGWKEMNDYMRENKIDVVKPELAKSDASAKAESASASVAASAKAEK